MSDSTAAQSGLTFPVDHTAFIDAAVSRIALWLHRELEPLTTADRNRLLLKLHSTIADELTALETVTND